MSGCLFCQIAEGERHAYKVFEGEGEVAFLDIFPCTPGHTLVIPRHHYPTLSEMSPQDTGRLFQTASLVAGKVQEAMGAAGFNLGVNNGRAAGQEVFHVHIHIIPRYSHDGGGSMKSVARISGGKDLEQIATTVRQVISSS
ncbi:MAG: HIT family protein [Candidatus Methylomirabilales bacterium]